MKPQIGTTSFSFTTSDDRELEVEATVYFDSDGLSEVESLTVSEDDEEIEFDSLLQIDKNAIDFKACYKAEPQDEVYDEYNDLEFE